MTPCITAFFIVTIIHNCFDIVYHDIIDTGTWHLLQGGCMSSYLIFVIIVSTVVVLLMTKPYHNIAHVTAFSRKNNGCLWVSSSETVCEKESWHGSRRNKCYHYFWIRCRSYNELWNSRQSWLTSILVKYHHISIPKHPFMYSRA